jgi:hypothetical protein
VNRRPGHIRSRRAKKAAITPIFVLHPSGSATHFLTALHSDAAVGFPDDCGEQLLATENSQPVICYDSASGGESLLADKTHRAKLPENPMKIIV